MAEYNANHNAFTLHGSGNIGVLLVHGMNCTPAEMRGLAEYMHDHNPEITVFAIKLSGHGEHSSELQHYSLENYRDDIKNGINILKQNQHIDKIFLVGKSFGALLSIDYGLTHEISGIVAISPPYIRKIYLPFVKFIQLFKKDYARVKDNSNEVFTFKEQNPPPYTVYFYTRQSFKLLEQVIKLSAHIQKNIHKLTVPILIFQGSRDKVSPRNSGKKFYDLIQSNQKELIICANSAHDIQVESEREMVWEEIYQFIMTNSTLSLSVSSRTLIRDLL